MLMKFADAAKLEGVTNNSVDRALIQMDLRKLEKSGDGQRKGQLEVNKNISWVNFNIRTIEQMNVIFGQNVSILKAGVVYLRGQDLARVVRSNRSLGPVCKQSSRPRLLTCVLWGMGQVK